MGLFGRNKEPKSSPLAYPGNAKPDLSQPGAERAYFTYTPERRARDGIPAEDLSSYMEAGYATVLGLDSSETFLAWGPVWVSRYDDDKEHEGTAVITPDSLLVWWQPSRRGLIHTFQAKHSAFEGRESLGNTSGYFRWDAGVYANDSGKFMVGNPVMYLAARFSAKDGHANRRTMTVYWTFAGRVLGRTSG